MNLGHSGKVRIGFLGPHRVAKRVCGVIELRQPGIHLWAGWLLDRVRDGVGFGSRIISLRELGEVWDCAVSDLTA